MAMAIIVAIGAISCLINSSRISHFGIKPDRGGSPPSDSKEVNRTVDISGFFIIEGAMEFILVELMLMNIRNIEVVKIIYNIKLSRVRWGA